jgi:hypothetical protein
MSNLLSRLNIEVILASVLVLGYIVIRLLSFAIHFRIAPKNWTRWFHGQPRENKPS